MKKSILLILVFLSYIQLSGDTVYLKNGRKIHGIITEQDTSLVKMEIAIGNTAFKLTDIDSIKKTSETVNKNTRKSWIEQNSKKNIQSKFFELEELLRKLKENYLKDESMNLSAFYSKKKKADIDKEIYELNQKYLDRNRQIKDMAFWDDPILYRQLLDERNSLHSQIELKKQEYPDVTNSDKAELIEAHSQLFEDLDKALSKVNINNLNKDELDHFNQLKKDYINLAFNGEDNSVRFEYADRNTIVVKVLINGRQSGRFVLDTGASCVVFSESFAKKLNLDISNIQTVQMLIADGSKVDAYPVMLASVAVGKFKSEQVAALVSKRTIAENIDGLLGMTYLKNYIINLDAQAKKLFFRAQ